MSKKHEKFMVDLLQTGMRYEMEITPIFRDFDLTPAQYNILRILNGAFPAKLNPGEIKSRMLFQNSDVTRLMDRLVAKGYVDRQTCESNRRKVDMSITQEGKNVLEKIYTRLVRETSGFYSEVLTEEDVEYGVAILNKIRKHITKD